MSYRWKLALVILAAGAVYLVGNERVALWDRDEPRNAQAARQMLQSGDWIVPRFLDKVRTAKPPFTAWCQAAAMSVLGDNAFAARLPSVVAMTLTLIVLAVVLTRAVDAERAFWTVFVLATSAIVIAWSARTSMTDAILLLWMTIAHLCVYSILRGRGRWMVIIVLTIAIGLGGLTKGPLVLAILAATLLAWAGFGVLERMLARRQTARGFEVVTSKSERATDPDAASARPRQPPAALSAALKTLVGIFIVAAIVAPWMYLVEQRAPGFLGTSIGRDVVQRAMEPLEQHSGPPGYYLLLVWGIYFPWSVLLPLTFVIAWRHRVEPKIRFALAVIIGPWILLECVQTKLPHYLLPVFPALAFLTADALVRCFRGEHPDLLTRGTRGAIVAWGISVICLGLAPWRIATRFDVPIVPTVVFSCLSVVYAGAVIAAFQRRRARAGAAIMGGGMMAAMVVAIGWFLPQAHFLRLPVCVADLLHRHGGGANDTSPGDVQMIGYKEPSLAFYQGGTIREQSENDFLRTHPPPQWPRWVVIRQDIWEGMPSEVKQNLETIGSCRGLSYADKGRTYTVIVARKK